MAELTEEEKKKKKEQEGLGGNVAVAEQPVKQQETTLEQYPDIPQWARDAGQTVKDVGSEMVGGLNVLKKADEINTNAVDLIGAGANKAYEAAFSPETREEIDKAASTSNVPFMPSMKEMWTGRKSASETGNPLLVNTLRGQGQESPANQVTGLGAVPGQTENQVAKFDGKPSGQEEEYIDSWRNKPLTTGEDSAAKQTEIPGAITNKSELGLGSRPGLPFEIDPNRSNVLTTMKGEDGQPFTRETINGPRRGAVDSRWNGPPGLFGTIGDNAFFGGGEFDAKGNKTGTPVANAMMKNWSDKEQQRIASNDTTQNAFADRTAAMREDLQTRPGLGATKSNANQLAFLKNQANVLQKAATPEGFDTTADNVIAGYKNVDATNQYGQAAGMPENMGADEEAADVLANGMSSFAESEDFASQKKMYNFFMNASPKRQDLILSKLSPQTISIYQKLKDRRNQRK